VNTAGNTFFDIPNLELECKKSFCGEKQEVGAKRERETGPILMLQT
jgi:hypothetical protein